MNSISLSENNNYPEIQETYEHRDKIVEVVRTIFGGKRITIRERGTMNLDANWCAGDKDEDKKLLLKAAEKLIDEDIDDYPFSSSPKPYYKDDKFMNFLKRLKVI